MSSTWDDGLPLRLAGGLDIGGRYTGVNQEMYWQDDQDDNRNGVSDKLERIVETLTQADVLAITSNRQYGTVPRVSQRYPLSETYYRALLGCQAPRSISDCMARAQPGEVHGELGYDLIAVFQNDPRLGPFSFNDQYAEEAFTVYDHPKVLIFARTAAYSADSLRARLMAVDLSRVEHLLPSDKPVKTPDLMLPADRLAEQRAGGTWSELFDRDALLNRSDVLGTMAWWLLVGLIGWAAFPLARLLLPGMRDGGYPLARIVGLVIVAWTSWVLSSLRVPFTRGLILVVLLVLALASALAAWLDRKSLIAFLRERRREIAWVELFALALFVLDLAIRLGNPDLWHPAKGGEKPMDLSYLTAVLKSTSFPPYDPWLAGGMINYYYYGFVLIAVPIKLLGIIPTAAYNLAIPTIFSMLGLAGYSLAYNLVAHAADHRVEGRRLNPRLAGVAAALALVLLGNLGTVQMYYEGLKRLGTPAGEDSGKLLVGAWHAVQGAGRYLTLQDSMPYPMDQWYWNPSRAIPPENGEAGPITEFPFFTFLYADLHAHMISRLLTTLALAWMVSWLLWADARKPRAPAQIMGSLFLGALALGALYPTNLGDYPTYWGLGALAAAAGGWVYARRLSLRAVIEAVAAPAVLLGLAYVVYLPFHVWYGAGYGSVELWRGSHTPLSAYLVVHGLFLFVLVSWLAWETREWMAHTPLSALARTPAAHRGHRRGGSPGGRGHGGDGECRVGDCTACRAAARMGGPDLLSARTARRAPDRAHPGGSGDRTDPAGRSRGSGRRHQPHEHRLQVLPAGLGNPVRRRWCGVGLARGGPRRLVARMAKVLARRASIRRWGCRALPTGGRAGQGSGPVGDRGATPAGWHELHAVPNVLRSRARGQPPGGLPRHLVAAGSCPGISGDRRGQHAGVPLGFALHDLHRTAGRPGLELAPTAAARRGGRSGGDRAGAGDQ